MIPRFRAWVEREDFEPDENFMMDVDMIEWFSDGTIAINDAFVFNSHTNELKDTYAPAKLFLMQSTGLKDKSNTEMFEGDKVITPDGDIGIVRYLIQEAGFVVDLGNRDYRLGHRNTGEHYTVAQGHKVVGNVYEGVVECEENNEF